MAGVREGVCVGVRARGRTVGVPDPPAPTRPHPVIELRPKSRARMRCRSEPRATTRLSRSLGYPDAPALPFRRVERMPGVESCLAYTLPSFGTDCHQAAAARPGLNVFAVGYGLTLTAFPARGLPDRLAGMPSRGQGQRATDVSPCR